MDDVGLAMVVCDSREHIKKTIDSVRDIVSEVLIVDQGSPEDLSDLCDIYIKTTRKGFGDPDRQWSCDMIQTPWIITLESDEYFSEEAKLILPELLEDSIDVYWFRFKNLCEGVDLNPILGLDYHPRIHRKGSLTHNATSAHTYPDIRSNRQAFIDKEVIHDRTYEKIKSSHDIRNSLLSIEEQQLEKSFLQNLDGLLRASKSNGSNISR